MLLLFIGWFVLMFLGIPISFSLIIATSGYLLFAGDMMVAVPHRLLDGSSNFTILAIPFFILAGQIMNIGGISERIFKFCNAWVGHFKGGYGFVNVLESVVFAAMSGSGAADLAGPGQIVLANQRRAGFPDDFNIGLTMCSSTIGPIVPPSIPMVVYGAIAGCSIGALFLGGIIPGLMMAAGFFIEVFIFARLLDLPTFPKATWKERGATTMQTIWALFTPLIIIVGIGAGIVTPTEAAIVCIVYALILSIFFYRQFEIKKFMAIVVETIETTGTIILIMASAGLFGWTITRAQLPQAFTTLLLDVSNKPLIVVLLLNAFMLVLGLFIEGNALIVILVPIILPIMHLLKIDLVYFGVVMVLNVTIGAVTPPVGTYLFIMSNVAKVPIEKVIKSALPWLIPLLIVLLLLVLFPAIVLFLPRLAGLIE